MEKEGRIANQFNEKAVSLQESLRNLFLQSIEFKEESITENLLIGKVLNTQNFRRFTILEIIQKTWRLTTKVQIEKINDNVFKLCFGNKKDRDGIFHGKPWSLNGALLILKEWLEEKAISNIRFDTTTFHVQIHGLPLEFLHQNSAEKIGNQIGLLHQESIKTKCVVGHRFICIRVDIDAEAPIPAGFFQDKPNGEESWI